MEPLEFMQRLAALVPRPRLHLIRFHGVLAPNARLRSAIISRAPVNANDKLADHAPLPSVPGRISWAQLLKRVFDIDLEHCPLRWHLEDHHRYRRSQRDRQDPNASRLARPSTTSITGAALRSIQPPDPKRTPHLVQIPEPTTPYGPRSRETAKVLKFGTRADEWPENSPILDRDSVSGQATTRVSAYVKLPLPLVDSV